MQKGRTVRCFIQARLHRWNGKRLNCFNTTSKEARKNVRHKTKHKHFSPVLPEQGQEDFLVRAICFFLLHRSIVLVVNRKGEHKNNRNENSKQKTKAGIVFVCVYPLGRDCFALRSTFLYSIPSKAFARLRLRGEIEKKRSFSFTSSRARRLHAGSGNRDGCRR